VSSVVVIRHNPKKAAPAGANRPGERRGRQIGAKTVPEKKAGNSKKVGNPKKVAGPEKKSEPAPKKGARQKKSKSRKNSGNWKKAMVRKIYSSDSHLCLYGFHACFRNFYQPETIL
jgi:hypothetical protein